MFRRSAKQPTTDKNMVYRITLQNEETGKILFRDYDLDKKDIDEFPNIIDEMKTALDDDQEKF